MRRDTVAHVQVLLWLCGGASPPATSSSWFARLPTEPPYQTHYHDETSGLPTSMPCWRDNSSLAACCRREGFTGCSGRTVRSRCCAMPGNLVRGDGLGSQVLPKCWVTMVESANMTRHVQDDSGPFWVRQRNYLVTFVLANPAIATMPASGAKKSGGSLNVWSMEYDECPWGTIVMYLRENEPDCSNTLTTAKRFLVMPLASSVLSGWPLFLSFKQAIISLRSLECTNLDAAYGSQYDTYLNLLEDLNADISTITVSIQEAVEAKSVSRSVATYQPGESLSTMSLAAQRILKTLHRALVQGSDELTHAGRHMLASERFWQALHELQALLVWRSVCPTGTMATIIRTLGVEYNICIRQPEAMGSWFGSSLVDKRVMNHGQWPECAVPALLLPPPTSVLSPSRWQRPNTGCIVLDLGANIGTCTLLFAAAGHRVVAIEPEPSNLLMLHSSLNLPQTVGTKSRGQGQRFGAVSIAPVAIDEAEGAVRLSRDPSNAGCSFIGPPLDVANISSAVGGNELDRGGFVTVVPTKPLDAIAEEHAFRLGGSLSDICLLKMDIEAAEYRALRSAKRLLAGPLRAVSFEFVPNGDSEQDMQEKVELLRFLVGFGFTIFGNSDVTSGRDSVDQERAYRPSEFEQLVREMAATGSVGTTLTALKF